MENDNKIDVIRIFNSIEEKHNSKFQDYLKANGIPDDGDGPEAMSLEKVYGRMRMSILHLDLDYDEYCSHSTKFKWFSILCSNENIMYKQSDCFHVTEVPCKEADFTYCFCCGENKKIQWRTHQIGNCPDTEYIFAEEGQNE